MLELFAIGLIIGMCAGMILLFARVRKQRVDSLRLREKGQPSNVLREFIDFWREASRPEFGQALESVHGSDLLRIWRLTGLVGDLLVLTMLLLVILGGISQLESGAVAGIVISLTKVLVVLSALFHTCLIKQVGSMGRRGEVEGSTAAGYRVLRRFWSWLVSFFEPLRLAFSQPREAPVSSSVRWLARITVVVDLLLVGAVLISLLV